MRRFYVTSFDAMHASRDLFHGKAGTAYLCLYDPTKPGAREQWEAVGKPVLVNATFSSEAAQDRFHDHPDVAILPHPVHEGNHQLRQHLTKSDRKFKKHHLDALSSIGVQENHSVLDLEGFAVARNKGMKLRALL